MQIICDNQEEYDELMKASKYLHDFSVWVSDYEAKGLNLNIDMVNTLCHIYCSKNPNLVIVK